MSFDKEQKLMKEMKSLKKELNETSNASTGWAAISTLKKDINKFYTLFDKRDELYMKYLNNFNKDKNNFIFFLQQQSDYRQIKLRFKLFKRRTQNAKHFKYT